MTGLYFPAVLGTGVVFLLLLFSHSEPWWSAFGDFRFWFGLLFVFFFSFSFFTITEIADKAYLPTIRPEMVAEVSYVEMTPDGLLRHVVYLGEREDKPARDVIRSRPT